MSGSLRVAFGLCAAGIVAVAIGSAASCDVYNSSLLKFTGTGGGAGTGGADAGAACHWGDCWWSKTDPVTGCHTAGMPTPADRPKPTGGADIPPIYLGIDQIWTGESAPPDTAPPAGPGQPSATDKPYQYFGFDLDGTCTNPVSCPNPRKTDTVSCRSPLGPPQDGQGCRDNAFAQLEPVAANNHVLQAYGVTQAQYNCSFYRGSFNILLKISGYNGKANDDTVRVDVYMSPGLEDVMPTWDCISDPEPQKDQPHWLSTQRWYVDQDGLSGPITTPGQLPPAKTIFDAAAYVRQGYLVARVPDGGEIRFIGDHSKFPGYSLVLHGGLIAGHLYRDTSQNNQWVLRDTVVAARVKESDFVKSFRLIGVCPSSIGQGDYDVLTNYLATETDILADGQISPNAPCDALSVDFAMWSTTITPGDAIPVSKQVDCPEGGTDAGPDADAGASADADAGASADADASVDAGAD